MTSDECKFEFNLKGHHGAVLCLDQLESGLLVSAGAFDHAIRMWDVAQRKCIRVCAAAHSDSIKCLKVIDNESSTMFISGSRDKTLKLWNSDDFVGDDCCLKLFVGHRQRVCDLQLNSRRNQLISCSEDGCIRVWDLSTYECVREMGMSKEISLKCIRVNPNTDEELLVSSTDQSSGVIHLVDLNRGIVLRTIKVSCNFIRQFEFM